MKPSFKNANRKVLKNLIIFIIIVIIIFSLNFHSVQVDNERIERNYSEKDHLSRDIKVQQKTIVEQPISNTCGVRAPKNNSPPHFIKEIQDLELEEDFGFYSLNLSDCALDDEDNPGELQWYMSGENNSLINVSNENSTTQRITIKSITNAFGEDTVKLWVVDTTGQMVYQLFNIKVRPLNDLPSLSKSDIPYLIIHKNSVYSINLKPYIIDVDNPIKDITITIEPEDRDYVSIKNYYLKLDFSSVNDFDKNYITLKLSDGVDFGKFTLETLNVNLTDNYPPKQIKTIPQIILYSNKDLSNILDLDYYFSDDDDEQGSLRFEFLQNSHLNIEIHEDNTVDIASSDSWEGIEQFIIRCLDPDGAFVEQIISVNITTQTTPIIFSQIPDLFVHYNIEYSLNLSPYICTSDPNIKPKIEIFEFIGEHWLASSELGNIIINFSTCPELKINYSGKYLNQTIPIFISVSSDILPKFQQFLIKVTPNHPPNIKKPIPDWTFDEDTSISSPLDLYEFFSDTEDATLEFVGISENVIFDIDQNGLLNLSSKKDWFGTEFVTLRAFDSQDAIIEISFEVTVTAINDPPVILAIPTINITQGSLTQISFLEYLIDVDNDISELNIEVDSEYIEATGNSLILNYPSKMKGTQTFNLIVSDFEDSSTQAVKVKIKTQSEAGEKGEIIISPLMVWGAIVILIILILSLLIMAMIYIRRLRSFKFNEIYLIYKDGLLIAHATHGKKLSRDSDIIGSMFTAIQDFIQESFTDSGGFLKTTSLKRLDFGEFQIIIDRGEHIYIAAVYSGFPIRKMILKIEKLRKEIESRFADVLPTWNGDMEDLIPTQDMIRELLLSTWPSVEESPRVNKSQTGRNKKNDGTELEVQDENNHEIGIEDD